MLKGQHDKDEVEKIMRVECGWNRAFMWSQRHDLFCAQQYKVLQRYDQYKCYEDTT